MSGIEEARAGLASTVAASVGFGVHSYLPERLSPPVGFVIPGGPYLEPGITFGRFIVRFECHLAFQGVNNEAASSGIDAAVGDAVVGVVNDGWAVESASEPFEVTLGGTSFLVVFIQVTREIAL